MFQTFSNFSDFLGRLQPRTNLALEASERPETRLELLTRTSSIRFFFHFLISSRIKHHVDGVHVDGSPLIGSRSTYRVLVK